MPPDNIDKRTTDIIRNSMPTAKIWPGTPSFTKGPSIFRVQRNSAKYNDHLEKLGFRYEPPIEIAFLADNFPSDSFTNEYGESFLNKMTDVVSSGFSEINQFFGSTNAINTIKGITKNAAGQGGVIGTVGAGAMAGQKALGELSESIGGATGKNLANMFGKMAAGGRWDFPQVWKNSGYQPSYSLTVRLFNPNPGNDTATKTFISGPLAAILLLGLPLSDDGQMYSWPFFHHVKCPAIWDLEAAVITNITVIKGGDQQQIAHNQRMGIVDVRIDFGSLYNSIIVAPTLKDKSRTTLESYINSLTDSPKTTVHYDDKEGEVTQTGGEGISGSLGGVFDDVANRAGEVLTNSTGINVKDISGQVKNFSVRDRFTEAGKSAADYGKQELNKVANRLSNEFSDLEEQATSRVPTSAVTTANILLNSGSYPD